MDKTPIKLNGSMFYLRYDLNALTYIEDNLGISLQQLDTSNIGAKTLLVCIYAGLIWDRKNCPARWDVGSWIVSMKDFDYAAKQFETAINASFGNKDEKAEDEPKNEPDKIQSHGEKP